MATCFNRPFTKPELLSYIGDPAQIAGAEPCVLTGGKADGVKAVRINTGGGMNFTVLPGRGMDIAQTLYKGIPLNFFSGTGIVSPRYFEEPNLGFLRGFFAGMLTSCGLTNMGAPSTDEGIEYGLHGRMSNSEAEDVSISHEWVDDEYIITVKGVVREVRAMGENLIMTRTIETQLGKAGFTITDKVENRGFKSEPLLILYHFNFGYPLLSPDAKIVGPIQNIEPRDAEAAADNGVQEAFSIPGPVSDFKEKVFFITPKPNDAGNTFISLINRKIGGNTPLAVVLRYNTNELPYLTEWKMPRQGFYALGLEPSTASPVGRRVLRQSGKMTMIPAQSTYSIGIEFSVLDNEKELKNLESEAKK